MLLMLLPNTLAKGKPQKKYYDFSAEFELNDLATNGPRVRAVSVSASASVARVRALESGRGQPSVSTRRGRRA